MKKTFIILILGALSFSASAQNRKEFENDFKRRMAEYSDTRRQDFQSYCDSLNMEFAEFMRERWERHDTKPPIPIPQDEPVPDTIPAGKTSGIQSEGTELGVSSCQSVPDISGRPQPIADIPEIKTSESPWPDLCFTFYGTDCAIPVNEALHFTLQNTDENSVADAWVHLTENECAQLVPECLSFWELRNLCDWGYIRFVEEMAKAFFGANRINEARLMQMYILAQSGYKVRMAISGDRIVLLLPSREKIYQYSYLEIDGEKYYVLDRECGNSPLYLFDRGLAGEQEFSLMMNGQPDLSSTADNYAGLQVYSVNKNLIDFYNDYPHSADWRIYVQASIDDGIKHGIYRMMENETEGEGIAHKVGFLLDFVQNTFEYQTDDEQFGYERPLFCDETFYYPYSDCEDRAILFATLVRELLGLEVALVDYPGHVAAAVRLDDESRGDYFLLDGVRFTICDPTYIGAGIGVTMPRYREQKATVIRIKPNQQSMFNF